jgi:predicted amino acid-binding ACT domain protein
MTTKQLSTPKLLTIAGACQLGVMAAMSLGLAACTPTLKLKVELAPIYAKLDVNVRVQLDKDVKDLATKNPDLF